MALKRHVIERHIPNIGASSETFGIYLAEDEAAIREHAKISGFPASVITEVTTVIDPTTESSGANRPD
jgi:hypothetical protein